MKKGKKGMKESCAFCFLEDLLGLEKSLNVEVFDPKYVIFQFFINYATQRQSTV